MKTLILTGFLAAACWGTAGTHAAEKEAPRRPEQPTVTPDQNRLGADRVGEQLLKDFQQARDAYLKQRADTERKMRGATAEQKELLREQLRQALERHARQREELRAQLKALREQLPDHADLVDEARERSRERGRRGE